MKYSIQKQIERIHQMIEMIKYLNSHPEIQKEILRLQEAIRKLEETIK